MISRTVTFGLSRHKRQAVKMCFNTFKEDLAMCSVMGCFDEKISEKDFINGFERTKSRGPDMSKVENYNGARLGVTVLQLWD